MYSRLRVYDSLAMRRDLSCCRVSGDGGGASAKHRDEEQGGGASTGEAGGATAAPPPRAQEVNILNIICCLSRVAINVTLCLIHPSASKL